MPQIHQDTPSRHIAPIIATPRRGLSCPEAALYIGLSQSKFLELVSNNKMPKPLRVDRRVIWDIQDLDRAFEALRDAGENQDLDGGWEDETP